jgi:cyclopropane fatty-acyl-phospholipid synthase-like methyltransferase
MSLDSFKNYNKIAKNIDNNDTVVSGRYDFQEQDEKRIILDVISKLDIQPSDSLLDIGCGPGTLLLPLSFMVKEACGIDNSSAINRIRKKHTTLGNVSTIAGNFLDNELQLSKLYKKILIYSVIHYLSSEEELMCFLSKALKLLAPGGRLLIGDIPNINKKERYEKSSSGASKIESWKQTVLKSNNNSNSFLDTDLITMNDKCYIDIINFVRRKGFESYILPEPDNLPFGNTRDDILIIAHK